MIFVGFMEGSKAIRYWDKNGRNIKVSRNFAFSENEELKELQVMEIPGLEAEGESTEGSASQTVTNTPIKQVDDNLKPTNDQSSQNLRTQTNKIDCRQMNDPQLRKPTVRKQVTLDIPKIDEPSKIEEWVNLAVEQIILEQKEFGFLVEEDCPNTVKEAIDSEEGENWRKAMEEEMDTLRKMGTWTLKDLPEDQKVIGCK